MDINIILTFFETNIYLFLMVIPFVSQLWLPIGAMFFILYAWAITNNLTELFVLFLIVVFSTVFWDILAYFIGNKLSKIKLFKNLIKNKKIKYIYKKSNKFFHKKWTISIFLSRFLITWVWPTLNYIVWLQSFSFKKFYSYVILWEILYASELLILWYIFKDTFEYVSDIISSFWLFVFLIFILYQTWKRLFFRKKYRTN